MSTIDTETREELDAIEAVPFRDRSEEQKARWRDLRAKVKAAGMESLGEGVGVLDYDSNNSGGSWWLRAEDWLALERAGWVVHWVRPNDDPDPRYSFMAQTSSRVYSDNPADLVKPVGSYEWAKDHPYMGAVATSCAKAGTDANAMLQEWELITGQNSADEGCTCCGPPHGFTWNAPDGTSRSPETQTTYVQNGFA